METPTDGLLDKHNLSCIGCATLHVPRLLEVTFAIRLWCSSDVAWKEDKKNKKKIIVQSGVYNCIALWRLGDWDIQGLPLAPRLNNAPILNKQIPVTLKYQWEKITRGGGRGPEQTLCTTLEDATPHAWHEENATRPLYRTATHAPPNQTLTTRITGTSCC